MLWEDDCLACKGLWDELGSRLRLVGAVHPTMASMQVGMGGSGLLIAVGYISHLAEYLLQRSSESAVDVLINAYMQQYSRPHFLSRKALAQHMGSVSTFDGRQHVAYGASTAAVSLVLKLKLAGALGDCNSELVFNLSPNVFESCYDEQLHKVLWCDAKHNYMIVVA